MNSAHQEFWRKFSYNPSGFSLRICDQLWFKNDLNKIIQEHRPLLCAVFPRDNCDIVMTSIFKLRTRPHFFNIQWFCVPTKTVSSSWTRFSIGKTHFPTHTIYANPTIVSWTIQDFRTNYKIYSILVNNIAHELSRHIDDDHCISIHIKRKIFIDRGEVSEGISIKENLIEQ